MTVYKGRKVDVNVAQRPYRPSYLWQKALAGLMFDGFTQQFKAVFMLSGGCGFKNTNASHKIHSKQTVFFFFVLAEFRFRGQSGAQNPLKGNFISK